MEYENDKNRPKKREKKKGKTMKKRYYNARWLDSYGAMHVERYWSTHRAGSAANAEDCRASYRLHRTKSEYKNNWFRIGDTAYQYEVVRVPNDGEDGMEVFM